MMTYSKELLERIYRTMVRIRFCEESLVDPILKGEIRCPCHLYSGEEAVAAGICASLTEDDYIFSTHRSHGHFLAKGGSMDALVAEVYCRETGCSKGRGGSMHLIDVSKGMLGSAPIVAGTIPLALGAALAVRIRRGTQVAVSFFGDGATGEGVLYEALNFAALKKLPIIFACENNFYSTHLPINECRVKQPIYKIAEPFGVHSLRVDGNDVLAVYDAGQKALETCRDGEGPFFLELLTYRFRGHVGPDDNIQGTHTDIRPREEIEYWLRKDPLNIFENYVKENRLLDQQTLLNIRNDVEREVINAHAFAKSSPVPEPGELMRYVFR
jgi:TPP-dependent pyruvate/acetoin dehydrogenase alpha subunit